jgi:hypothetical protein
MKKFSAGGAQGKYDRRMADIKKDFEKDSKGKSGRALEVLEAKRAQRIADAEDDRAKRMGTDRTATRKAEYDAEKNLSRTRKFGADKPVAKAEPVKTTAPAAAPAVETAKAKPKSRREEFNEAFRAARNDPAAMKRGVFTFKGEKFTTNIAGEGRKASTSGGTGTGTTAAASAPTKLERNYTISPENRKAIDAAAKKEPFTKTDSRAQADLKAMQARRNGTSGTASAAPTSTTADPTALLLAAKTAREKKEAAERKKRIGMPAYERMAKGGKVKKEKTMKYRSGGSTSSKPPQPTAAERAAGAKFRKSVKDLKVTPENAAAIGRGNRSTGMAKGGKMATKFGAAMKKKSADTKGRAMMKFAKGGSIDGCAVKGKTKTSMIKMKKGGSC